jgi:ParB family chromosome partitioning protein
MARKDVFAGLTPGQNQKAEQDYKAHGAAKALIMSVQEFAEKARTEGGILEIDADLIDPSPFPDRLPDDDPQPFEDFKKSLLEEGQKVPIQVRPHPSVVGRFQVVYGHRRLRAAKELGTSVKAISIELSDADLVIAQGVENGARQDLSWIEKALFARRMEEAGVKPRDIYAALSIERTELAKLRAVSGVIPIDVIEAIGRAPKGGRPRWQELAKWVDLHPQKLNSVRELLAAANNSVDSNQKLQLAIDAYKSTGPSHEKALPIERKLPDLGAIRFTPSTPRGRKFAKFIESRLPALIEEFEQGEN